MTVIAAAAVTASAVLAEGWCSPQCLLGREVGTDGCGCRCGGEFHGVLLGAEIPVNCLNHAAAVIGRREAP